MMRKKKLKRFRMRYNSDQVKLNNFKTTKKKKKETNRT